MSRKKINEKRIDELMEAITLYTTQREEYDRSNFNACTTCIGFVGGLIAAVGAILCTSSNYNNTNLLNEAVSIIILLIPAIITLFLYNFSMNCRRSATFNGYVQFLEECLNKELGKDYMMYSNIVIPRHYATFSVNSYGPVAMISFLIIIYLCSFVLSFIFAHRSTNCIFYRSYLIIDIIFILLSLFFNGLYIKGLLENDKAIKNVKETCTKMLYLK